MLRRIGSKQRSWREREVEESKQARDRERERASGRERERDGEGHYIHQHTRRDTWIFSSAVISPSSAMSSAELEIPEIHRMRDKTRRSRRPKTTY
jgi:hypothetical protein